MVLSPSKNWRNDNFLGKDPPSTKVKQRPVDPGAHAQFATEIRTISPEKRSCAKTNRSTTASTGTA